MYRKRVTWRRVVAWLLAAALTLVLAGVGHRAWRIWQAAQPLLARMDTLQALAADPAAVDPGEWITTVPEVHSQLVALRDEASPFLALASHLGWIPRFGPDLQALPPLLDMAIDLAGAGEATMSGLAPLLSMMDVNGVPEGRDPLPLAVHTLLDARPQLRAAQVLLGRVEERRAEINAARLSPRLRRLVEKLDRALPLAQAGLVMSQMAPDLLGASGPRTYLLLAQNSDELRPTGGFVTGAGPLTLDDGNIVQFSFRDSYFVDDFSKPYDEPPLPLYEVMLSELWVFRDANWSPDFPTSARKVAELYTYGQGVELDGVIAFDQQAAARLIATLEPITVEGWNEPVTGDNFVQIVRQAWNPSDEGVSSEWARTRKDFLGQLAQTLLARVRQQPKTVSWMGLARALWQALEERHMLVYLKEPAAASWLHEQGWDGALRHSEGDYLMVVDANLGFNKTNPYVERSLEYQVTLHADGSAQAVLAVHYQHTGQGSASPCNQRATYAKGERVTYENLMEGCYWNYLRIYVPEGSHLKMASPRPTPAEYLLCGVADDGEAEVLPGELGKTVFGQFFVVEYGQAMTTWFEYDLPGVARLSGGQWRYALSIQKQPGTGGTPVMLAIALPPGARLVRATPNPSVMDDGHLALVLKLDADAVVQVIYEQSATTP